MRSSFVPSNQTGYWAARCSLLIYLVIVCCTQTLLAQEQTPATLLERPASLPTKSPKAKETVTGSIKGRVIIDGGNAPANTVVNAVDLNGSTRGTRTTRVDVKGRFVFDDLPVAVYTVMATAPGYLDEGVANGNLYDLRRQLIGSDVTVRMVKGGVITGTVTNAKGEPVVGVNVAVSLLGKRDLAMTYAREGGTTETDDRGVYRLYGLPPGEYVVTAGGRGWFGRFVASGFENNAPTYYPASTRDTATPVTVRSGEETTGIDISYRGLQGYSVSGSIMQKPQSPTGVNVVTVRLWHVKSDSLVSIMAVNLGTPTRSFSFDGVADGEYEISAIFVPDPTSGGLSGSQRVIVKGSDVSDIAISLSPLSSIEGAIKLEPVPTEEKCDKRGSHPTEVLIHFKNEAPNIRYRRIRPMYAAFTNSSDANSAFSLRQLEPGKFRFDISLPTEAWYLNEIKIPPSPPAKGLSRPPQSAAWQGIGTLKAGEAMTGVVIGIGQNAAGLRGRVSLPNEQSTIAPGMQVHLIPVEREYADNVLRHYQTNVETDGLFSVSNIAPGRYFLISRIAPANEITEPLTPAAWTPALRAKLRRDAEALQNIVELKGCQRIRDQVVAFQ